MNDLQPRAQPQTRGICFFSPNGGFLITELQPNHSLSHTQNSLYQPHNACISLSNSTLGVAADGRLPYRAIPQVLKWLATGF